MIDISRRAFLTSTAALASIRFCTNTIICSLQESRLAFKTTVPFPGLLVESGVGFAADSLAWLHLWGIYIGKPRHVNGPAWVRFDWPLTAMIRDFGRISPIRGGTVIARLDGVPVAVRQGPLVVLGSPIGPHMYAGDPEALNLFAALTGNRKAKSAPRLQL